MDYRLQLTVKNNNILKRIEQNGYKSIFDFLKKNKKSKWIPILYDLINLKKSPMNSRGEIHPCVKWLCKIFDCGLFDLFTKHQIQCELKTNKVTKEVKEAELLFYHQDRVLLQDEILENKDKNKIINKVLETLDNRENFVIKKRFGLNGENESTLEEIANLLDVRRERVRQIEARALRKLRHNSRIPKFKDELL